MWRQTWCWCCDETAACQTSIYRDANCIPDTTASRHSPKPPGEGGCGGVGICRCQRRTMNRDNMSMVAAPVKLKPFIFSASTATNQLAPNPRFGNRTVQTTKGTRGHSAASQASTRAQLPSPSAMLGRKACPAAPCVPRGPLKQRASDLQDEERKQELLQKWGKQCQG